MNVIKELQQENALLQADIANNQTVPDSHCANESCSKKGTCNKKTSCCEKMSFRQKYAEKIFDSLPDMMTVVTDKGMTVAIVSSEETNHTGIPREEIYGVSISAFLPDHVQDHVMESIEQAIETGKSESMNHLMFVNGEPHYFENRTVRIDHNYNLCVSRDITEVMMAKTQLESLSYAVNQVNENIFALDSDGKFLFANQQFLKDHHQKEVVGKSAACILFSCQQPEEWEKLKKSIHANNGVLKYIAKIGEENNDIESYEIVAHSIRDINNDEEFWFFARDISEIRAVEKQLRAAKIEAEQSNKLKSAFLANMSHEIRTPLNAIIGFSKLILMEEDRSAQEEFSEIIDRNADLLLQLINDILDLSKIEAGTLDFSYRTMDFNSLCCDMLNIHRIKIPEGVSLIFEGDRHKPLMIHSDRNRLAQVFTNLLSNAIKFTPSGEIRFGYTLKQGMIEAFVRDTGMGISAEKTSFIFDRFVKFNNFVQGTGLGLAITKTIVEKLGGSITVESREGKGSEFRFTVPCLEMEQSHSPMKKAEENRPVPKTLSTPTRVRSKKMIMIVEDNESNYLLLQKYIGNKYTHCHANNGLEAIDLFKKHLPDLIIMDIKMPIMDGIEATKRIRNLSTHVPIIALTAFAYESDKEEAYNAGCNHFLTKPLSFSLLESVIEKYLSK